MIKETLLQTVYDLAPFDLHGDCTLPPPADSVRLSCIINFYGRLDLLEGILFSLVTQKCDRTVFEVVLVEDRGGTPAGKQLAEAFGQQIDIRYIPLDKHFGTMGYSRNYGLRHSRGEHILFLDDDTVILDSNFLETLLNEFDCNPGIDALVPHGNSVFSLLKGQYSFHDPYFMTSRCTAYRRSVLTDLSGFMDNFVGQEDVEFVIRFTISGKKSLNIPALDYYHPPLLVPNLRKPKAVGNSFYNLRNRYSLIMWLLVILNCSRHAPLFLLPVRRFREMGRFGIGFLLGVLISPFDKKGFRYG